MLLGPSLSPLRPSERLRCLVGRRYFHRLLAQTAGPAAVATDSVPAVRRACLDSTNAIELPVGYTPLQAHRPRSHTSTATRPANA